MTTEEQELARLRAEIDAVDEEIHARISKRASLALAVANIKKQFGDQTEIKYYRPEREAQVLRHVMDRNDGPLDDETVARLFREIMSACLALEAPMQVAYLGPEGTFTQAAALKHFGHSVKSLPFGAIDEVFREVEAGSVHFGVVPVENSTEGVVNHTLDSFLSSSLKICGEVELRIHQHLLKGPHTREDQISRVYSHQQSLAQCRKWLDSHLPMAERVAVSSNAEAARRLQHEWNAVAIAGSIAAETYGLEILHENIEDRPDNTTRFIIIGRDSVPASGDDKTSILVSVKNRPGALYQLLRPFDNHNISLTRIETRPSLSGTWSYVFFIDFEGHVTDPKVKAVLDELEAEALEVKCLGSYPKAVL